MKTNNVKIKSLACFKHTAQLLENRCLLEASRELLISIIKCVDWLFTNAHCTLLKVWHFQVAICIIHALSKCILLILFSFAKLLSKQRPEGIINAPAVGLDNNGKQFHTPSHWGSHCVQRSQENIYHRTSAKDLDVWGILRLLSKGQMSDLKQKPD